MEKLYSLLSALLLMFVSVTGLHAQEPGTADFAGDFYCKTSYSNDDSGIKNETRYVYFTIAYYAENDSLSLVALGEKDAMQSCGSLVTYKDGELTICQTVDQEGAENGTGYAYYMGNAENFGHIHCEPLSKDKILLKDGITLCVNNWADTYEIAAGGKLYRVGTPEDPDVEPVVNLSPYAGQYYMQAEVNGEPVRLTFTMAYDAGANKLYLTAMGYEGSESDCTDDSYEVVYNKGTFSLPVVFTPDYTLSVYAGSFTAETPNKFVVTEDFTGDLNMFDVFTVPSSTVIRRVGTVEEAWESIGLADLAGTYKLTCSALTATGTPEEGDGDDETEAVKADIYFTLAYEDGVLMMTSVGTDKDNMTDIDMSFTQTEGTLNGGFYFGMDCNLNGEQMSDLELYITSKDRLTLTAGFDFFDYNTFMDYVVSAEELAVAVRVSEIPSSVRFVKDGKASSDVMYDLSGHRILAPRKGQIYIQNGKKFMGR